LKCFMRGSPRHTAKCSSKIPMKRQSERKIILKDNRDKVVECATIREILNRNTAVEAKLRTCAVNEDHADLASLTVHQFLTLNSSQLQDFVHARKFVGKTFEKSKLVGADGKLNKTRYKTQTAESIEKDCSEEEPCLVWHAWRLRSQALVLKPREEPDLNTSFQAPKFSVVYARPAVAKKPSEYLKSQPWVDSLKSVVKGVGAVAITNELMDNADSLALALEPRLDLHIDDRVDLSRQDHFTLRFTRDNLSSMAAAMCLVGHVVSHVDTYRLDERLLALPIHANFGMITGDLAELEGCYLYFDPQKYKWIRSGKTSGDGKDACFRGRGKKHLENAKSKDEMREHRLYREYPAIGVENLGVSEGNFDNLSMHCGMAYDKKEDITPLIAQDASDGLFVWSDETLKELKSKSGEPKKLQLDAVAYLWEMCYDLVLAKAENVSTSPGFESLGLRVNRKRKRSND